MGPKRKRFYYSVQYTTKRFPDGRPDAIFAAYEAYIDIACFTVHVEWDRGNFVQAFGQQVDAGRNNERVCSVEQVGQRPPVADSNSSFLSENVYDFFGEKMRGQIVLHE
jgi:hypothetical protein